MARWRRPARPAVWLTPCLSRFLRALPSSQSKPSIAARSIIILYIKVIYGQLQAHPPSERRPNPPVCRSASPATSATAMATLSERRPSAMGMRRRISAALCTVSGTPALSRPKQQHLVAGIGMVEVGPLGGSGQQYQGQPLLPPPGVELAKGAVPHDRHPVEIIHPGAAEGAVGHRKAGRFDDMRLDAQTGAQAQNRAGILRDVRLVKGDPHQAVFSGFHSRARISRARRTVYTPRRAARPLGLALSAQGCQ